MAGMPAQIWMRSPGKSAPEWVDSYMATGKIEPDGSFDIDTPDGPTKVNIGDAVFVFDNNAYVCPPRLMQDKLREIAPEAVAAAPAAQSPAAVERKPKASSPPRFKPVIGAPCTPANIPVDQLLVDDSYQRSIEGGASQKAIEKIAINWDWRLCLPLLGSRRRDGKIYIIDGQHRVEGARLRGDIPWLPVVIFDLADPKDEAELFIAANRSRRAMGVLDDFHAAVVAGDEKVLAISAAVQEAGLEVGRNAAWQYLKAGEVIFVRGVGRALTNHGREIAVLALRMIAAAFPDQPLIGASPIFDGLVELIAEGEKSSNPIEFDLMHAVLAEVGLKGWKDAVSGTEGADERNQVMRAELRRAYDEARAE